MNSGGVAAVIDYIGDSQSNVRLPGIMMLGYVAAHSENLAMAVIVSKVWFFSEVKKTSQRYVPKHHFICGIHVSFTFTLGSRAACYCPERRKRRSHSGRHSLGTRSDRSPYPGTCKSCSCCKCFTKITSTLSQDGQFWRPTGKGTKV